MRDTPLARISSEAFIFLGAGAAVLRQMANPGVGQGVADHSRTLEDPLGRLHSTMQYIYVLSLGSEAERREMAQLVNRAHVPVRSKHYSAFDPHLQLWVAATLYQGAVDLQRLFYGALSPGMDAQLYAQSAIYGTTLQMPADLWPTDRDAFDAYWQRSLEQVQVSEEVRRYVHLLLQGGSSPWYIKTLMPLQRFCTRALIEPELRTAYQLPWSQRDQRRWEKFCRYFPAIYRLLPATLRHLPARLYLRAWRNRLGAQLHS